ncbi:hypothetical protein M901_0250, partial [Bacteriovorax sp. DB6_IX]
ILVTPLASEEDEKVPITRKCKILNLYYNCFSERRCQ